MEGKRTFKGAFTCRWAASDGEKGNKGDKGDKGDKGEKGETGVGVQSADVVFVLSSDGTNPPADSANWVTLFSQLQLSANTYVWSCTKTVLTNGTTSYSGKQCFGESKDFVSILELYALGDSGTVAPSSGWASSYTSQKGKWLWSKNRMQWTNGSYTYTNAVCVGYFATDGSKGDKGEKGDKGDKGNDGTDGTDGNGIESQESLFVATDKKNVTAYSSVSGWSNRFPQPTEQKPYVWKSIKTTYTNASIVYSTPELVTTYQSGANGNILRNASFTDASNMSAWTTQSTYNMSSGSAPTDDGGGIDTTNKLHGHNSYFDRCSGVSGTANYKDVLVQAVHYPSGNLNNIVGGQWYTLSFWAKKAASALSINQTISSGQYVQRSVYLKAGVTYRFRVFCQPLSSSYPVTTTVTRSGYSSALLTFSHTSTEYQTKYLTASATGLYIIRSTVSGSTGTVNVYAVEDDIDLLTYLAPGVVDTNYKVYVDGEERTPTSDLRIEWKLSNDWSFHTLTFRAKSSLSTSVRQQLYFRLDSVPHADIWRKVWICEPKLESGMMYTGYVDSSEDLKGIPGMVVRTSEWAVGVLYHNDENLTGGVRYLDVVTVTNSDGSYSIYQCRQTHTSTASNKPSSSMWTAVNKFTTPIYTPLIIADNAVLRFGQTNRMLIMNSKQKIQGCFGGVEDEKNGFPLWIGGESAEKANFRVGYDGTLYAKKGEFSGVVRQNMTYITPTTLLKYFDKSVTGTGLSQTTYFNFKWDSLTLNMSFSGDYSNMISGRLSALKLDLPTIVPGEIYNPSTGDSFNTGAMDMIGTQMMIVNKSANKITLFNHFGRDALVTKTSTAINPEDFDMYETSGSLDIPAGYMARLVCLLCNTSAGVIVGWEYQKAKLA